MHAVWTIAWRDLRSTLRSWRTFLSLALLVGGVMGVLVYVAEGAAPGGGGLSSHTIYNGFTYSLRFAAFLMMPAFGVMAFASERRQDTFSLLYVLPMRRWRIVLGKWLAVMLVYLLFAISLWPLAGVLFFMVGIDWVQFLGASVECLALALVASGIGLYSGVHMNRSRRPMASAYGLIFLLLIFGPYLFILAVHWIGLSNSGLSTFLTAYLTPRFLTAMGPAGMRSWAHIPIPLITVAPFLLLLFWRSTAQFRKGAEPPKERALFMRILTAPVVGQGRGGVGNQASVDAQVGGAQGRLDYRIRRWVKRVGVFLIGGLVLLVSAVLGPMEEELLTSLTIPLFAAYLLMLASPLIISALVAREYTGGTMDALRMTLISPWRMVRLEYLSGLRDVLPLLGAAVLGSAPVFWLAWTSSGDVLVTFLGIGHGLAGLMASLAVSQLAGLFARHERAALVLGLAANMGYMVLAIGGGYWGLPEYLSPFAYLVAEADGTGDVAGMLLGLCIPLAVTAVSLPLSAAVYAKVHLRH